MTRTMTNTLYALVRKGFLVHPTATLAAATALVLNLLP